MQGTRSKPRAIAPIGGHADGTRTLDTRDRAKSYTSAQESRGGHKVASTSFCSFHFLSLRPSVRTPMPSAIALR
jgi:hypothetical protein